MAEGPSLRTQVSNLRSKDDLEAVFEHADGFLLIDQDDGAFIPELRRAEAALFPDDAPSNLRSLELVTRLDKQTRRRKHASVRPQDPQSTRRAKQSSGTAHHNRTSVHAALKPRTTAVHGDHNGIRVRRRNPVDFLLRARSVCKLELEDPE